MVLDLPLSAAARSSARRAVMADALIGELARFRRRGWNVRTGWRSSRAPDAPGAVPAFRARGGDPDSCCADWTTPAPLVSEKGHPVRALDRPVPTGGG